MKYEIGPSFGRNIILLLRRVQQTVVIIIEIITTTAMTAIIRNDITYYVARLVQVF